MPPRRKPTPLPEGPNIAIVTLILNRDTEDLDIVCAPNVTKHEAFGMLEDAWHRQAERVDGFDE